MYFNKTSLKGVLLLLSFCLIGILSFYQKNEDTSPLPPPILSHEVNPQKNHIHLFYKDATGRRFGNFKRLKQVLTAQGKTLLFAMNGGMFHPNHQPVGLYIEKGKTISPIDLAKQGKGNFYLLPNGVFYLTKDQKAGICSTVSLDSLNHLLYATQSGPMLVIEGQIHPKFNPQSQNLNIRNGVGILPNGNLLFALSTQAISFYTLASFFKDRQCSNALYLDGFISKTYLPQQNWIDEGGDFGVIIGQIK